MAEKVTAQQIDEGISVRSGVENELIIPFRIIGARPPLVFPRFKTFPEPSCLPLLQKVLDRLEESPGCVLVVVGHTDAFGSEASNQQLSQDRARAVAALLSGNEEFLESQFSAGGNQTWGPAEAARMIDAITADPDFPPLLAPGENELARFRQQRGLGRTGTLDAPTRRKIISEYLALLGPKRPTEDQVHALGGGSDLELEPLAGSEDVSDDPTSESFVHPRGVEVFLFEGLISPAIDTFLSGPEGAKEAHKKWSQDCSEVLEPDTGDLRLRLRDSTGTALANETVELISESGEPVDAGAPVSSTKTSDASGIVNFSVQTGTFTVRVANRKLEDETIVKARRRFSNKFELDVVAAEEEDA